MMLVRRGAFCFFLVVSVATAAPPKTMSGKVVAVADGDTITVLVGDEKVVVRLAGIDAPEKKQAYGPEAKEVLKKKILNRSVDVGWSTRDRYGRVIGEVTLAARRISLELIAEGFAWHYTAYSKDAELAKAEAAARIKKVGLWAEDNPVPPWEYRKPRKKKSGLTKPKKVL